MSNLYYFNFENFQIFYDKISKEILFIQKDTRMKFKGFLDNLKILNLEFEPNFFYRKYPNLEDTNYILYLILESNGKEYLFKNDLV